jgi:hypothetical protein
MEVTLRGKNYTAEYLTDLNYLPLGNLFLENDGQFALDDVTDYESLSNQRQFQLTQPILKRMSNPDIKAAVAQSLSAIFPSFPKDLVSYRGKGEFNLNINLPELLKITISCSNELNKKIPELKEEITQANPEITARKDRIKQLENELFQLRSNK